MHSTQSLKNIPSTQLLANGISAHFKEEPAAGPES
jgi:hypothetical protein